MVVVMLSILWFVVFFAILYCVIKSAVTNSIEEILHPADEPRACPSCHEECAAGSRFCPHCGHSFSKKKQPEDWSNHIRCPHCTIPIPAESLYCPQCGKKLF